MQVAMLRYDKKFPDQTQLFAEFGIASCKAQELEALLKLNLQHEMIKAGDFSNLCESDASALKNRDFAMGPIFNALGRFLDDAELESMIRNALVTRNKLVHRFFIDHGQDLDSQNRMLNEPLQWCRNATAEFTSVCIRLEERWLNLSAQLYRDPDALIPGLKERIAAIERGEWDWPRDSEM